MTKPTDSPVLAVVGLAGAGKSSIVRLLEEDFGYARIYFGGFVVDEVAARRLPPGQNSEKLVREELRKNLGMAAMAILSRDRIAELLTSGSRVVIDGLYSFAEYEYLKESVSLTLIAVHAKRRLREKRMADRAVRPLDPEELARRDLEEIQVLDKAKPIVLADYHIVNDDGMLNLTSAVRAILSDIYEVGND